MKFSSKTMVLTIIIVYTILSGNNGYAHGDDDPLLASVVVDQLEIRHADGENPYILEAQAWIGQDIDKLWIKADVEHLAGHAEEMEVQMLYSRAIAPFWDIQAGWRKDIKPEPGNNWAVIGIQGLAPYFFDVGAALFLQESGDIAARISVEYELMLTQQWVLVPEMSLDIYGQSDEKSMTGSGVSSVESGIRLRYEIYREFAPYMGIVQHRTFGDTTRFVRRAGEETGDTQWVMGIHAWF